MALNMTSPTKHPKSGVYRVRQAIPPHLREATRRLFGKSTEFIQSLNTKDAAEAKRRAPPVVAKFQGWIDAAARDLRGEAGQPTRREVGELVALHYARRTGTYGDTAVQDLHEELGLMFRDASAGSAEAVSRAALEGWARKLLTERGYDCGAVTVGQLADALAPAERALEAMFAKRLAGDWSEDPYPATLPKPRPQNGAAASTVITPPSEGPPPCPMDALLDGWGLDRGWRRTDRPINRNFYDRLRTLDRLRTFLGHADAARVTKADVVRWKQSMQAAGRHVSTIRNDLSEMSAVWAWGISNGLLPTDENPFRGVSPRKAPTKRRHVRAFTPQEARTILTASRRETGFLRLLPWVLCLTGARLNEVMQATKDDVTSLNGVAVLRIHDEGPGRSVKNKDSRRAVPIHPALVAEGFLSHVAGLPAKSPLWPDVDPDALFGQRSTTAGKKLGIWLRGLGINDPAVSPAHSWRHWFVEACRAVQMHPEVRSALTGHSAKMDESAAYGTTMGSFIEVLGEAMASVRSPVP